MKNYILSNDVLCFSNSNKDNKTLVIEKGKKFDLDIEPLKLLKLGCSFYGNSYNMQKQFIIDIFNYYIKTPIVVSPFNMFIFFPTAAPNSKKCIWINYGNVERYVKSQNTTVIYFNGGKVLNIDTSYTTIDNQITKCIKIEKYLSSIIRRSVQK